MVSYLCKVQVWIPVWKQLFKLVDWSWQVEEDDFPLLSSNSDETTEVVDLTQPMWKGMTGFSIIWLIWTKWWIGPSLLEVTLETHQSWTPTYENSCLQDRVAWW